MIQSVLQKITITMQTSTRLILREQPLLEWLLVGMLCMISALLLIAGLRLTSGAAFLIALFFFLRAPTRYIIFDVEEHHFLIQHSFPLYKKTINHKPLAELVRAELYIGEDEGTQIILMDTAENQFGLSGYTQEINAEKEEIVLAINKLLGKAFSASG